MLPCVAVCCSELQCVAVKGRQILLVCVLQCLVVCEQCVAVCCSVLQCAAVRCSERKHIYIYVYIYVYTCVYSYIYTHMYVYVCIGTYLVCIFATHYDSLHKHDKTAKPNFKTSDSLSRSRYTTLQHTTTHCNTLQHTATNCNTL